ncbi:calpain-1 catalytic subunit [Bombina bombina]|uniref:calpain-1 catalytic subunit n=1 Tax=Bombina bombina TaxID=8345 RepID=UPI00235ACF42|nr:calpain-1 catalytic subunit [Bombina bombina]
MGSPPTKRHKSLVSSQDLPISSAAIPRGPEPLFVDTNFPQDEALQVPGVEWRRPKEICACPRFVIDGATRMDVCQGRLSNCWFLSAVACLSLYPQLLEQVVPPGQDFGEGYDGRFRFQFWQYGQWVDVIVDDLLPTSRTPFVETVGQESSSHTLLFMHSPERNEFWSSLLEKAYAKLKGGYAALQLGFAGEALVDMTGGIVQKCDTSGSSSDLWVHLNHLLERGALICCGNTQGELETSNLMGILSHHMYSVTGTNKVQTIWRSVVSLLRVRNPWGHTEWNGPWRDGGPEWQSVTGHHKTETAVVLEDGEFWMEVGDFQKNFQVLEICHLGPQSLSRVGGAARPWDFVTYEGRWVKGLSAGGSINCRDHFWMNPQFSLTLREEDHSSSDSSCSFIVSVTLKHQRLRRAVDKRVACHIFQGDEAHAYLFREVLHFAQPLLSSGSCDNPREAVLCSSLPPGRYVIIPSLEQVSDEGEFLLRVLTEKESEDRCSVIGPNKGVLSLSDCPSKDQIRIRFLQFSKGSDMMTGVELHCLLVSLLHDYAPLLPSLPLETCHSLMASMDTDAVGFLCWEQFHTLWKCIEANTRIFCKLQVDTSGKLGRDEVVPALQAAGLPVDDFLVHLAQLRFADEAGSLSYPHFISCLVKLQSVTGKFQAADPAGSGTVTLNYRQWLQLAVYS